jgi:hypothetical protein
VENELQVQSVGSVKGKTLTKLKEAMPDGELVRWKGSGFRMPSQKDEFFWVVKSMGIAFGLDYDRNSRARTVISVTIFKPQGAFQPEGCLLNSDELVPVKESQDH